MVSEIEKLDRHALVQEALDAKTARDEKTRQDKEDAEMAEALRRASCPGFRDRVLIPGSEQVKSVLGGPPSNREVGFSFTGESSGTLHVLNRAAAPGPTTELALRFSILQRDGKLWLEADQYAGRKAPTLTGPTSDFTPDRFADEGLKLWAANVKRDQ